MADPTLYSTEGAIELCFTSVTEQSSALLYVYTSKDQWRIDELQHPVCCRFCNPASAFPALMFQNLNQMDTSCAGDLQISGQLLFHVHEW
eukprot:UN07398